MKEESRCVYRYDKTNGQLSSAALQERHLLLASKTNKQLHLQTSRELLQLATLPF
jgi:hypothetical protein